MNSLSSCAWAFEQPVLVRKQCGCQSRGATSSAALSSVSQNCDSCQPTGEARGGANLDYGHRSQEHHIAYLQDYFCLQMVLVHVRNSMQIPSLSSKLPPKVCLWESSCFSRGHAPVHGHEGESWEPFLVSVRCLTTALKVSLVVLGLQVIMWGHLF